MIPHHSNNLNCYSDNAKSLTFCATRELYHYCYYYCCCWEGTQCAFAEDKKNGRNGAGRDKAQGMFREC